MVQEPNTIRIIKIEKSEGITGLEEEGFAAEDEEEEEGTDASAEGGGVGEEDAAPANVAVQ